MIIPDNISPFPVLPTLDEETKAPRMELDCFVCDDAIREILVGPIMVTPLVTSRIPSDEAFAGRDDVCESLEIPFVALSSDEAYADEATCGVVTQEEPARQFEPGDPHPALAEPSHVSLSAPRIKGDHVSRLRHTRDRWWVLGMGLAMLVVFGSGTLIEIVSNEALRRSRVSQSEKAPEAPAAAQKTAVKKSDLQPLAASDPEYPAP
jgi:hypothetical protein